MIEFQLDEASGARPQQLPLVIEVAAAAIIATTIRSPFGEPERATGRWLPYLRLSATLALSAFSLGVLAAVPVGANLPGGVLELVRNLCGLIGIGALGAATLGGEQAWTGVFAYGVCEYRRVRAVHPAGHGLDRRAGGICRAAAVGDRGRDHLDGDRDRAGRLRQHTICAMEAPGRDRSSRACGERCPRTRDPSQSESKAAST